MLFIRGIVSVLLITICRAEETVTVDTSLGAMKGLQMETRFGKKFWSFRGIRYAEPPVGELRFQNPQPVKPWKPSVFDATLDGPMCPQVAVNRTLLSEDCLRLNVYTENVNSGAMGLKPVIVYLHPGGFHVATGISVYAAPQYFMERDIVLVTLNYRLASLGFLATGTVEAPGNMGLKDQAMALRWIQANIERFGGDPKSVTLWGYSAGSFSIGLHMLSPMSRGLFHRGIMQSSFPLSQIRYRNNQSELAERQARLLKCPVGPVKEMIKCLKTKPMLEFVDSTAAMFEVDWNPGLNWMPVVEPDVGQERFLLENPYATMRSGKMNKVPLITGITEYELYFLAYDTLRNDTQRERFNKDFEKYSPIYFLYDRDTPKSRNVSQAIRSFYFENKNLEFPQSLTALSELYNDALIFFEYHRFMEMVSEHVPVYTYIFNYTGRYSHFRDPNTNQTYGAMHLDELLYLLYLSNMTPMFTHNEPENIIVERLTRMWYEFARKGNPNNATDEYLKNLEWPLYDDSKKERLVIGNELTVKCGDIFPQRMQLWDRLYPIEYMLDTST